MSVVIKVIETRGVRAEIMSDDNIRFHYLDLEGFAISYFPEKSLEDFVNVCERVSNYFSNKALKTNCELLQQRIIESGYKDG
jgi:hypothetical protein